MVSLFDPLQIGDIETRNRIWMSPLTRLRATREHVPTELMIEYYAQRAKAGLIISEGTGINQEGLGAPCAPGIWNEEQVEAWKPITKAVHDRGGKIIVQMWHMGRATHSNVTGVKPVSSSATKYPTHVHTYAGKLQPEVARPLSVPEIKQTIKDYGTAAKNAIEAGFDGVQIHGANGYLVDEFLRDSDNHRTDEYGGSIDNRIRFLEEVVAEVTAAVGSERTSLRLSPNGETQGTYDSHPEELFSEVAQRLNKYNLAFLELREVGPKDTFGHTDEPKLHPLFNKLYSGTLVLNQEYTRETAEEALKSGIAAAVTFGRPFMSNPDLVEKIAHEDDNWTPSDVSTWYSSGPKGYTDFPIRYNL